MSITQVTAFSVEAPEEAIARYGRPEIFNTDQDNQFTSITWTGVLKDHGIQILMDGKGQWTDTVFIERLWRSLKYACVYLNARRILKDAQRQVADWIGYYNDQRPHSKPDDLTPSEVVLGFGL